VVESTAPSFGEIVLPAAPERRDLPLQQEQPVGLDARIAQAVPCVGRAECADDGLARSDPATDVPPPTDPKVRQAIACYSGRAQCPRSLVTSDPNQATVVDKPDDSNGELFFELIQQATFVGVAMISDGAGDEAVETGPTAMGPIGNPGAFEFEGGLIGQGSGKKCAGRA
jgi:hypothetical protein